MTTRKDALSLAELDAVEAISPDPSIWGRNLDALRDAQPKLAEQLVSHPLPDTWRFVRALDGSPTVVVETTDAGMRWLDASAAPGVRDAALLEIEQRTDVNLALPTIGLGGTLRYVLDHTTRLQAVFVFERVRTHLAAGLRLFDFADDLRDGRIVLVPPVDEAEFLARHLEENPGLLPPGVIIAWPTVDGERITAIRTLCERLAGDVQKRRSQRLAALRQSIAAQVAPADVSRLAVWNLGVDPRYAYGMREIARAVDALQWQVVDFGRKSPREVHPLYAAKRLAESPTCMTIFAAPGNATLPIQPPGRVVRWHLRVQDLPDAIDAADGMHHAAASPTILNALRRRGAPNERLIELFWGCAAGDAGEAPTADDTRQVLLVADCPAARPELHGIEQPSHKKLWEALWSTVKEAVRRDDPSPADVLLRRAETANGISLHDAGLRAKFAQLITNVVVPATVSAAALETLRAAGRRVAIVGSGWSAAQIAADAEITHLGDDCDWLSASERLACEGVVFADALDPLHPALPAAVARGRRVLVYLPGADAKRAGGASSLPRDLNVATFANQQQLAAYLAAWREDASRPGDSVKPVDEAVLKQHGWNRRLETLIAGLGLPQPPTIH